VAAFARWLVRTLPAAVWTVVVALLPWWMGLSLVVLSVFGAVAFDRRIVHYAELCRRALRWGLPGLLFAMQRALGGDLIAWGAALLGALVGFSLVVLMESLLDHRVQRTSQAKVSPEWSELAMASVGPPAHIIELAWARWQEAVGVFTDAAGPARFESTGEGRGRYLFAQGKVIDKASPRYCFSPGGRWFAANLPGGRGEILWDTRSGHTHRLMGWQLSGWDGEQPWLARGSNGVPTALHEVLGQEWRR
jgi:prepilin signal peptidase PulO-like enzyme (type II secretory pathway)